MNQEKYTFHQLITLNNNNSNNNKSNSLLYIYCMVFTTLIWESTRLKAYQP